MCCACDTRKASAEGQRKQTQLVQRCHPREQSCSFTLGLSGPSSALYIPMSSHNHFGEWRRWGWMEQHELPATLHTPIQCCWTPLKSSLWPHGCLPSPLQRGWKQRRFSQHGPNAESSFGEDCQGEVREETQGHCMGPGDHRLCSGEGPGCSWTARGTSWWCQYCEPGTAARHGGQLEHPQREDSWSVLKGRREVSPPHITWSIWMAL